MRAQPAGAWLPSYYSIAPGFDTKALLEADWVGLVQYVWEALECDGAAVSSIMNNHLRVLAAPPAANQSGPGGARAAGSSIASKSVLGKGGARAAGGASKRGKPPK